MNRTTGTWHWDDVRFFLAVARAGSLSAAARALDVGHVTVGRRIEFFEKRLGVTLFNRTPDGLATTSAGESILRQCMAMESAALDLERIAAGSDALVKGAVRVTTTEGLAYQLVAPVIAALCRAHPELQIDLMAGVRSLDIARRDADLAVRFARPSASGLVCRKLGEVGFSLYASRRYLAKSGTPKRGQGLAGHDLISFTGTPAAISPFFMGESLDGAHIALRCDNALIQLKAAANEAGIVELACFLGDSSPDLVRIWPDEMPARRTAWMIFHQDMRRSARMIRAPLQKHSVVSGGPWNKVVLVRRVEDDSANATVTEITLSSAWVPGITPRLTSRPGQLILRSRKAWLRPFQIPAPPILSPRLS